MMHDPGPELDKMVAEVLGYEFVQNTPDPKIWWCKSFPNGDQGWWRGPGGGIMAIVEATWTIELNVDCPGCGECVDLTAGDDFWGSKDLGDFIDAKDEDAFCPKCGHEFDCDYVY